MNSSIFNFILLRASGTSSSSFPYSVFTSAAFNTFFIQIPAECRLKSMCNKNFFCSCCFYCFVINHPNLHDHLMQNLHLHFFFVHCPLPASIRCKHQLNKVKIFSSRVIHLHWVVQLQQLLLIILLVFPVLFLLLQVISNLHSISAWCILKMAP